MIYSLKSIKNLWAIYFYLNRSKKLIVARTIAVINIYVSDTKQLLKMMQYNWMKNAKYIDKNSNKRYARLWIEN